MFSLSFANDTPYCCGVGQIGCFNSPDNAGNYDQTYQGTDELDALKMMLEHAQESDKAVVHIWFNRPQYAKELNHKALHDALDHCGYPVLDLGSYVNPNSGNVIQGYQINLVEQIS